MCHQVYSTVGQHLKGKHGNDLSTFLRTTTASFISPWSDRYALQSYTVIELGAETTRELKRAGRQAYRYLYTSLHWCTQIHTYNTEHIVSYK